MPTYVFVFACHDFLLVFFLPKFTNLHEHTRAHNYSAAMHVKTKVVVVVAEGSSVRWLRAAAVAVVTAAAAPVGL